MRLAAAAFLLVTGIECGSPRWTRPTNNPVHPGRITVCLELPKEQLPAAHRAVAAWDGALYRWNRVEAVDAPDSPEQCTVIVRMATENKTSDPSALAWCECVGCRDISMMVGRYEMDTQGILQHELGHALGAQHAGGTLMNPTWNHEMYSCPDRTTVLQVAAWNHIDEGLLSWCF